MTESSPARDSASARRQWDTPRMQLLVASEAELTFSAGVDNEGTS